MEEDEEEKGKDESEAVSSVRSDNELLTWVGEGGEEEGREEESAREGEWEKG